MYKHPAKYSDSLLPILSDALSGAEVVLDPFAGTGKLRQIRPDAYLVEIEPEWAEMGGAIQGDALNLPFSDNFFDAVCTSPCYGNRMADHHNARDGSRRNTYRHLLGRPLNEHNSGSLQWGEKYREFHRAAWTETRRVLKTGGRLVLNVSDHIRGGNRIPVSAWHAEELKDLGFRLVIRYDIPTPRNRFGQNGKARVEYEHVFVFFLS